MALSWPPTTSAATLPRHGVAWVGIAIGLGGLIALAWSWPPTTSAATLSRHGVAWVGIAIGLDCLVALAWSWPPTTSAATLSRHGVAWVGIAIGLDCLVAWVGIDGLGCLGALVWSWPPTTNHVLILMVATTLSIDIGLIALAWSWPVLVDDTLSRHGVAWVGIAIGLDCLAALAWALSRHGVAWVGIAIGLGCLVALAWSWPPTTSHVLVLLVAATLSKHAWVGIAIGLGCLVALAWSWPPTTSHVLVLLVAATLSKHGVAWVGIAIGLDCLTLSRHGVAWVCIAIGLGCLVALAWSWPPTTNHVLTLMVATTLSIDIGVVALAWSWPPTTSAATLSRHGVAWVGIAIGLDCLVAWVGIAIGLGCLVALACKWPPTTTHVLTLLVAVAIGLVALACMWQPTTYHVLLATSLSTHHGVALVGIAIVLECLVAHLALVGQGLAGSIAYLALDLLATATNTLVEAGCTLQMWWPHVHLVGLSTHALVAGIAHGKGCLVALPLVGMLVGYMCWSHVGLVGNIGWVEAGGIWQMSCPHAPLVEVLVVLALACTITNALVARLVSNAMCAHIPIGWCLARKVLARATLVAKLLVLHHPFNALTWLWLGKLCLLLLDRLLVPPSMGVGVHAWVLCLVHALQRLLGVLLPSVLLAGLSAPLWTLCCCCCCLS